MQEQGTERRLSDDDAHALTLEAVTKEYVSPSGYPVAALGPVDLRLARHEFVVIVGPSGCGKSTLLRLAAGLIRPTTGTVALSRAGASFVFQEPALLPWRTVAKNCELPLELAGVPKRERHQRVARILDLMSLGNWAGFYPHQLSGGMKMRASLARALVADADVIYFDEPFSATDEINRARLNEYLTKLWMSRQFAAVFVTHSIEEAVFLAERVVVMSERPGRILGEVRVRFPFPRSEDLRTTEEFVHVEREVVTLLHGAGHVRAGATDPFGGDEEDGSR